MYTRHDDVIKWKHFRRYWPFVRGIHRSPVNSLHKGQWRRALMFSLICVWINDWVNNREAGDLIRHRAHYDVTVMVILVNVFASSFALWCLTPSCSVQIQRPISINTYAMCPQHIHSSIVKNMKTIYRSDVQVALSFSINTDVYRYFIQNDITFTKYCITEWISKYLGSLEIYWMRQYLAGLVNAIFYKTEPIFTGLRHDKLS